MEQLTISRHSISLRKGQNVISFSTRASTLSVFLFSFSFFLFFFPLPRCQLHFSRTPTITFRGRFRDVSLTRRRTQELDNSGSNFPARDSSCCPIVSRSRLLVLAAEMRFKTRQPRISAQRESALACICNRGAAGFAAARKTRRGDRKLGERLLTRF